jgi:hypothetical protein
MEPRLCNSVIWILVGLGILLLMFHHGIGLLAAIFPISLLMACVTVGRTSASTADAGQEKR